MIIEVDEKGSKLAFFEDLYREARAAAENKYCDFEKWYKQYKGSNQIDSINETPAEPAKQVRNITYELVESQVSGYIPTPKVSTKIWSEKNERCALSIENMLRNKRDELPYEKLNDMDERFSPIYGGSVWLIEWDESIVTHNTVGDIKVSCIPPTKFIGQPKIYDTAEMEYCFIEFETTKEDIERKYGTKHSVAWDAESDEYSDDKTATLKVCYYKNDNDKVCQYVWSADTQLLDLEDYFARKRNICKRCGRKKALCHCENSKESDYELISEEYEEIDHDIQLSDGNVIPAYSEVIEDGQIKTEMKQRNMTDQIGNPVFDNVDGVFIPVMEDYSVPIKEPTKLPYYRPNILPIVIRKNTSEETSLFGQSDCEFIRPQQQGINKVESRMLEKIINGGVYAMVHENFKGTLNNNIFGQVIKVDPESKGYFDTLDMQSNISQDIAEAERLYDQAKRIIGISDSFQGQYDASAKSGVAKEAQIRQASGRLDSKRQMKNAAYADMDKIIFQYYLAYADEPRPAVYNDAFGRIHNMQFNRYDFIMRDEAGEYYYNDEFLFSTDASVAPEKSRETMWQENLKNFQMGAFGSPESPEALLYYWMAQERAHYPYAHENVEYMRDMVSKQQQMSQMQTALHQAQHQNKALQAEIQSRAEYEQYIIKQMNGQKE